MSIKRNDPCFCNSKKKWKNCCFPEKPKTSKSPVAKYPTYNEEEAKKVESACKVTRKILEQLCDYVKPGITTGDLETLSIKLHEENNVIAGPLNYGSPKYPATICVSVNEEACHGIPGKRVIKEGDILNIDVSCIKDKFYGDCSNMVAVGKISPRNQLLIDTTTKALNEAIKICKDGVPLRKIGEVIESIVSKEGFSVLPNFVGHGIGRSFHEAPSIIHLRNNYPGVMKEGMIFTIEPIVVDGNIEGYIDKNNWTFITNDGSVSAQVEHTILIQKNSCKILT